MKRATSVTDLLTKNIECFEFDGPFYDAFDQPEKTGVWFVWGNSGNGKTSFTLQLAKYLTRFDNVLYNSLEEGTGRTMQRSFERLRMEEVKGRLLISEDNIEDLDKRLRRRKSPKIVFIDSIQYSRFTTNQYYEFINRHKNKLLVFISQTKDRTPIGAAALASMYSASLKIWVEGYRAFSKGRYIGQFEYYDIWPERSYQYWLQ